MSGLARLRAAVRLVVRGYRGGQAPAAPGGPRRRQAVERGGLRPGSDRLSRYLAATGGEGLPESAVLPPLFPSTWETLLALELLSTLDPPLPLGAVVHTGSEILLPRAVRRGDELRCRVEVERLEPAPGGVRIELTARNWASAGQLCTQAKHTFRIRTGDSGPRREPPVLDLTGWQAAADWALPAGAGRRYARASGDWNPIHLWWWTARPLGFRRPILHGLCTAAMVAHALCREWGGDPGALRRLRIAFRAPLLLPGQARLWTRTGERGLEFRVTDAAGGQLYAEGEAGGGAGRGGTGAVGP